MKKSMTYFVFLMFIFGIFIVVEKSYADKVYFKNGFKVEGDVVEKDGGIWVAGGFFKNDEIDRIEKFSTEGADGSWIDKTLSKIGVKEEKVATTTYSDFPDGSSPAPANKQKASALSPAAKSNPLLTGLLQAVASGGGTGAQPSGGMFATSDDIANKMGTMSQAMEQAQMLQQQAQLQQLRMQQQIQQMEGGGEFVGDEA